MATKTETIQQYILVIQDATSKGSYIYETSGDWGPSHLPTNSLVEALKININDLQYYDIKRIGWNVKPLIIDVTFAIK